MKNPLYRFLANVVSWFAANFMSRLVAAILFFILTHTSSLTDTGSYSLATTFLALSIPLTGWGFEHLTIREVSKNKDKSHEIVGEFLVRRFILTLFTYSLLVVVVILSGYSLHTRWIIGVACLSLVTDGLAELLQAYLIAIEQTSVNLWSAIPANILRLTAGIWILVNRQGALGLVIVLALTSIFRCVLLFVVLSKTDDLIKLIRLHSFGFYLAKNTWRRQFVSAAPFVAIDVAWIVELQAGVIILSFLLNEEAVAIYSSAFAIVSMLLIISYAFMYTIFPVMVRVSQRSTDDLRFVYEKLCLYMLLLGTLIAAVFSLVAPDLYALLYPHTYSRGASVLFVLVWSLIFTFVHAPISRLMLIYNKQKNLAWWIILGALSNIALNFWFIPWFGIMGAAWARLGSYGLFFVLNFRYVNAEILHIDVLRLFTIPSLVLLSMLAVIIFILPETGFWRIAPALLVFWGLVAAFRLVNGQDFSKLHRIFADL